MRPQIGQREKHVSRLSILGITLAILLLTYATSSDAQQVFLPDSPAGWAGQLRDHRDVSEYLAFHKARLAERLANLEGRQTTNQAAYDARFYDLDLDLDPGSLTLTGTVRVDAEIAQ